MTSYVYGSTTQACEQEPCRNGTHKGDGVVAYGDSLGTKAATLEK